MLVASKPTQDKRSARLPASNEMGWLTAVAVAFLMVHLVACTIWSRASAREAAATPPNEAICSVYD
jgi:hypothetical protein